MNPKTPRPVGPKKYKATVKKLTLHSLKKYASQLEEQLNKIYSNPDEIVGKLATGYNQMLGSNQRLSSLCACLLKGQGGKVTLSKDDLESFKDMAVNIKWELPEGTVKPEDATGYIFSYDAIPQAQVAQQAPPQPTVPPSAGPGAPPPDIPSVPPETAILTGVLDSQHSAVADALGEVGKTGEAPSLTYGVDGDPTPGHDYPGPPEADEEPETSSSI